MNSFRDNIAWKYITAIEDKEKKRLLDEMLNKYKGTAVECDPLSYELDLLAEEITEDVNYTSLADFLNTLTREEVKAVYRNDLDYRIIKKG